MCYSVASLSCLRNLPERHDTCDAVGHQAPLGGARSDIALVSDSRTRGLLAIQSIQARLIQIPVFNYYYYYFLGLCAYDCSKYSFVCIDLVVIDQNVG